MYLYKGYLIKTTITYEELLYLNKLNKQIKVETPQGYDNVNSTFEKTLEGVILELDDGTHIKCAITHTLLCNNLWVPAIELKEGMYLTNKYGQKSKKITKITKIPEQRWIDFEVNNEFQSYIQNEVIHHNSGKSVVIYCIVAFLYKHSMKGVVLVPSISLTTQILGDFKDYNASEELLNDIRLIGGDNNVKILDKQITISTWQSLMKMQDQMPGINYIIVDEAHGLKKDTMSTDIVYNAVHAQYRIGLTGTLPDDPIAKMSILACVGAPKRYIRTQGLIERGLATPVHINVLKLRYSNEDQALFKYVGNYTKKLKFIKEHENRNMFISKVAHKVSINANSVIMCSHTEHMKDIFTELMKQKYPDVKVENKNIVGAKAFKFQEQYCIYYIAGATKAKDREKIISILKEHTGAILVSNYALFSTGISINNLKNILFASPMKSYTTITQSIGRAIRLYVSKNTAEIYDFCDDFSVRGNSGPFYNQYQERLLKSYNPEGFPITERTIII